MPEVFDEKDVEERLKFRWLMLKNSTDDPALEAYLITSLEDLYKKHSLKIPQEISTFIRYEKERIKDFLKQNIKNKKAQLGSLVEKRKLSIEKQLVEENKKQEAERLAKISRTKQIFGDSF